MKLITSLALSSLALSLAACGITQEEGSQFNGVVESPQYAPSTGAPRPFEVVVFYSGENVLSFDLNTIADPALKAEFADMIGPYKTNWMAVKELFARKIGETSDPARKETLSFYLQKMEADEKMSAASVKTNANQLQEFICQPYSQKSGLIVFSNADLLQKRVGFCKPGEAFAYQALSEADLKALFDKAPELKSDMVYRANPLSNVKAFEWALALTGTLKDKNGGIAFPADSFSRVLISGVHGGGDYALTPMSVPNLMALGANLKGLTPDQANEKLIADLIVDRANMKREEAGGQVLVAATVNPVAARGKEGNRGNSSPKRGNSSPKRGVLTTLAYAYGSYGIVKDLYAATLMKFPSYQFSLVFIESCDSFLGDELLASLRKNASNIGSVFASDRKGLDWLTIKDYTKIGNKADLAYMPVSLMIEAALQAVVTEQK